MSSNTQRRLLILINAFEPDAPNAMMLEVARAAKASGGWEVVVGALRRQGPLVRDVEGAGLQARHLGMGSIRQVGGMVRLWDLLRDFKPDVFHASLTRPAVVGTPLAGLAGCPSTVVTQHGTHEWNEGGLVAADLMPTVFRWVGNRASRVVTVSEAVAQELRESGVRGEKLRVIPNGVDCDRFRPGLRSDRAVVLGELGFPQECVLIGAAGNLRTLKGHGILVKAAALIVARHKDVRFALWGDGPCRHELNSEIEKAGLAEKFRLAGRVTDTERHLAACDLFAQPSLYESFGLAAAEAMACGVPVVASAVGGLSTLVADGTTGILVPSRDSKALALGLDMLLRSPNRMKSMATAARARITEHFSMERMTGAYLGLYEELVGKGPGKL